MPQTKITQNQIVDFISTSTQTALNLKANLSGGIFTGGINLSGISAPSTPASGTTLYSDTSNRFSWIGTNGFTRTFDGTANTANRVYTLPNASGNVALTSDIYNASYLLPIYCMIMGNPATSQAATANMVYYTFIDITVPCTADAIVYNVGGVSAGNVQAGLYRIATANKNDNANTLTGSTLIASSASTAVSTANLAQAVPLSTSITLTTGKYFLAIQFSNGSATFMRGGGFSNGFNFAKLNTEVGFTLPATVITASANSISPYIFLRTITTYI